MKAKLINEMMFILPETEEEKKDLIKWGKRVLENYDSLMDWMFWIETEQDEESVFEQ